MTKLLPLAVRDSANSHALFQSAQVNRYLNLLGSKKYNHSLEIGAGKGYFSYITAKAGLSGNCFACDIYDDFQMEEIKPYVGRIEYKNIVDRDLPFFDSQFDLVFSIDVIEHVDDDLHFVSEHLRVCKPGGTIIIGTPNLFRITNLPLIITKSLRFPRKIGTDTYGNCIHLREYSRGDIVSLLASPLLGRYKFDYDLTPCFLGVMSWNIGFKSLPSFLGNYCNFWFLKITKH